MQVLFLFITLKVIVVAEVLDRFFPHVFRKFGYITNFERNARIRYQIDVEHSLCQGLKLVKGFYQADVQKANQLGKQHGNLIGIALIQSFLWC